MIACHIWRRAQQQDRMCHELLKCFWIVWWRGWRWLWIVPCCQVDVEDLSLEMKKQMWLCILHLQHVVAADVAALYHRWVQKETLSDSRLRRDWLCIWMIGVMLLQYITCSAYCMKLCARTWDSTTCKSVTLCRSVVDFSVTISYSCRMLWKRHSSAEFNGHLITVTSLTNNKNINEAREKSPFKFKTAHSALNWFL